MVLWEQFVNYNKISFKPCPRKRGQGYQNGSFTYADKIAAFDIETTRFPDIEQSIMYVWQFAIGEQLVIMGRTWGEFVHMMENLQRRLYGLRLMIFVHNLSFEGQFLSSPYIYQYDNEEVFAIESRQLLKLSMYKGSFELRDSYKLFNLPLSAVTKRFNCQYSKQSGDAYNYDKIRLPSTPLTHRELMYCICDVLGLTEAVRHQMELHEDNLYSLPFTQTGYVRREAKRLMRPYHKTMQDIFPSPAVYDLLRAAFRGGNTHANRYFTGEIIDNVHGIDISSSYPTQQVLEDYPIAPFREVGELSRTGAYLRKCLERHIPFVAEVVFYDIRLKYQYEPIPYIPRAKCQNDINKRLLLVDNGRVIDSNGLYLILAVTDIDFKIIEAQYTWQRLEVRRMYASTYGPMFDGLRELNIQLYRDKTALKGIPEQKIYYDRAKEMLNGIYGMSCQDPLQPEILFSDPGTDGYTVDYVTDLSVSKEDLLDHARKRAFTVYQLGVWTTAHARAELQRVVDLHKDYVIYCDTDSVMYIGGIPGLDDVNREYMERDLKAGGFADDANGQRHYLGIFEREDDPRTGYKYQRFITQGAKKYAFEKLDKAGKPYIGITVAGVPKRAGAKELERKGGLEAFKPGFVFDDCGKLAAIYNDDDYGEFTVNGEKVIITRNVTLSPTTYTLDYSKDYAALLSSISDEKLLKLLNDPSF